MTALAQRAQKAQTDIVKNTAVSLVSMPLPAKRLVPPASLKQNLKPLTPEQANLLAQRVPQGKRLTLLDEVGRLVRPVAASETANWRKALVTPRRVLEKAAAHLRLGEWELAQNEQPERALSHFRQAQSLVKPSGPIYGLAAYDSAMALHYNGAYAQAAKAFQQLLKSKTYVTGFERRNAALFARHSAACAGYHAQRSAAGIPEPPRLDPLCAASGLAISLRAMGRHFDKKSILPYIRYTGEGSNVQDILDAAKKLNVAAYFLRADEQGLISLPKPLIAHVEHDHFITVTQADKNGVTYFCSDCGAWPGGSVRLSWKQWRMMEADSYVAVTGKGSALDTALGSLTQAKATPTVLLASSRPLQGGMQALTLANLLKNHVVLDFTEHTGGGCGSKFASGHCPCPTECPTDANGNPASAGGSSKGDPVNLATGEEEYAPDADITVYNPVGPSVSLNRIYNSLRPPDDEYQSTDFGIGWSHTYNVGIIINQTFANSAYTTPPSNQANFGIGGGMPPTSGYSGSLVFPNGSKYTFHSFTMPSAGARVPCELLTQAPVLIDWVDDNNGATTHFEITFQNRTKYITQAPSLITRTMALSGLTAFSWFPLGQIAGESNNRITFNYATRNAPGYPLLSSIANPTTTLLSFLRATDGSITRIADAYNRSVFYNVSSFGTTNVSPGHVQAYMELDHVSQIVPPTLNGVATTLLNAPARYDYGYTNPENQYGEGFPFLHTITVPSPTGAGNATTTINYDGLTGYVTSIEDANGNKRVYTQGTGNINGVTVKDSSGNTFYTYSISYDSNMSEASRTNGNGSNQSSKLFGGTYPYNPTSVTDANSKTWTYEYDQYNDGLSHPIVGNVTKSTSPRGVVTTYTYDFTNFEMGELISVTTQDTNGIKKRPTTFTYYEPSGLIHTITAPQPGTANNSTTIGSGSTVTYTYTYDSLGNVLTETGPGNGTATTITTTYTYTGDGTSQTVAYLHQPLTRTDNLGHTTHMRYDTQGNLTSVKDALGNETTLHYNIANQLDGMTFPPTSNDAGVTGSASLAYEYQYPGGPKKAEKQYNEKQGNVGGVLVWEVDMTYGPEGEMLTRTGSTQPYTVTYDPLYRLSKITDGNNGMPTTYFYNDRGYLSLVTYPGYVKRPDPNDPTKDLNITHDANDNYVVTVGYQKDTVQLAGYDAAGNLTKRIDGKAVVTNYTYADVESKLTAVTYPASTSLNVTLTYDTLGRTGSITDKSGVQSFGYDDRDEKTLVNTTYKKVGATGNLPLFSLSYTYYDNGSRYQLQTLAGNFTYTYDGAARLTNLSNPTGQAWTWSYLDNNWLTGQNANSKVATAITRNNRGFVTDLLHQNNALTSTYAEYGVGYSDQLTLGHITAKLSSSLNPIGSSALSGATYYTHDSKLQLTQEQTNRPAFVSSGTTNTTTFAYNGAGDPTTFRSTSGLTYNADNQRTGVTYDGNGNPGQLERQHLRLRCGEPPDEPAKRQPQ